jgi:hypothetical protein
MSANITAADKSMYIPPKKTKCPTCERMCLIEAVEMVPGRGILFQCIHEDGSLPHEYSEYADIDSMRASRFDDPSPEIRCPECSELGIVKAERDESDRNRPDKWRYYIRHPDGKTHIIEDKERRDEVLKAVGRYLPKKRPGGSLKVEKKKEVQQQQQQQVKKRDHHQVRRQRQQHKEKKAEGDADQKRDYRRRERIECPICNEEGSAALYNNMMTVSHYTKDKRTIQHHMITPIEKQRFMERTQTDTVTTYRRLQAENRILKQKLAQHDVQRLERIKVFQKVEKEVHKWLDQELKELEDWATNDVIEEQEEEEEEERQR